MSFNPEHTYRKKAGTNPHLEDRAYRTRQLLLIGRLQEAVSHELMNSLTKAILGIDAGKMEMTKKAIYHSAALLQELQQLGGKEHAPGSKTMDLHLITRNAFMLSKSFFAENQIIFTEKLIECPEAKVRFQPNLIALIELLLISAESLRGSFNRTISLVTDGNTREGWIQIECSGSNIDFDHLETSDLHFIHDVFENDKGSLSFEKNPLGFQFKISYPRLIRTS